MSKNYSSNDFLMKKKTLLVFNKNNYFEPLCKVIKKRKNWSKNKTTYQITKFFYKKDFASDIFNISSNVTKTINDLKIYDKL